jgi:hypothetical protein
MAEDPSKSLFTFEHLIIEKQWGIAYDWSATAAGFRVERYGRAGCFGSSNG